MKVLDLDRQENFQESVILALGNFDGLHLGHQALIHHAIAMSECHHCLSGVLLFKQHTRSTLEHHGFEALMSRNQKLRILEELGIDVVLEISFDEALREMSPQAFIENLLIERLHCLGTVTGEDYRFGYRAQGDVSWLQRAQEEGKLLCWTVPAVLWEGKKVSSTWIRDAIREGDLATANALLGRPYAIEGTVIHGKKLGRTIGFPTANIGRNCSYVMPRYGVYDTDVVYGERLYPAATSVGINPTVRDEGVHVEAHFLNFSKEIYGEHVEVKFLEFLRPEIAFDSLEPLAEQIKKDCTQVKNRLTRCADDGDMLG